MKLLIIFMIFILNFSSYDISYSQDLGDVLWEIQIPNNPGTTLQDKQIRSLKQIPDVNGDNVNDVVAATGNYWTICYSGINGAMLWSYSTYFGSINSGSVEWEEAMAIADINNDGAYEVVIGCGGGNEMIYALNGSNGSVIWSYGDVIGTSDGDIEAVNIRYDFNNDGINDVLASASGVTNGGRHAAICLNGLNGEVIFYKTQPEPFTDDIIATESGGAVGVNNNGAPYKVTGLDTNGNSVWSYTSAGNTWSLKEIPDINGDSLKDIIGLGGFTGYIFTVAGNTGSQIWAHNLSSSNNGKISLFDDADGNGFMDISLSAPQIAYRIDSKTGNTIWSNTLGSSYIRGIDNTGDVTGDSIDDIVIATQVPARLLVLNGINGNIIFDYIFGTALNQRGDRAAVLNDIDSNGVNEFLGGNREGRVICFYGGNGILTSVSNGSSIPEHFGLRQNFPNPFNPVTHLEFGISDLGFVSLKVYDVLGKEVATLVNEIKQPGYYTIEFDGSDLSSGIYFYKIEAGSFVQTKRMILLK